MMCAQLLLGAGFSVDETPLRTGHDALDKVLRKNLARG
jgi:hypothetical protein